MSCSPEPSRGQGRGRLARWSMSSFLTWRFSSQRASGFQVVGFRVCGFGATLNPPLRLWCLQGGLALQRPCPLSQATWEISKQCLRTLWLPIPFLAHLLTRFPREPMENTGGGGGEWALPCLRGVQGNLRSPHATMGEGRSTWRFMGSW